VEEYGSDWKYRNNNCTLGTASERDRERESHSHSKGELASLRAKERTAEMIKDILIER